MTRAAHSTRSPPRMPPMVLQPAGANGGWPARCNGCGMQLTSPAFGHGGEIPTKYTADGQDVSPPLEWTGVPPRAESLALIVDDPDAPDPEAPKTTWVHWVIVDM